MNHGFRKLSSVLRKMRHLFALRAITNINLYSSVNSIILYTYSLHSIRKLYIWMARTKESHGYVCVCEKIEFCPFVCVVFSRGHNQD